LQAQFVINAGLVAHVVEVGFAAVVAASGGGVEGGFGFDWGQVFDGNEANDVVAGGTVEADVAVEVEMIGA